MSQRRLQTGATRQSAACLFSYPRCRERPPRTSAAGASSSKEAKGSATSRAVGGIVTLADLQKPALRMRLFCIVTLIEQRFAELIDQHCPDDGWMQHLSESRLEKARSLQEE